jgi:hypothetical protein
MSAVRLDEAFQKILRLRVFSQRESNRSGAYLHGEARWLRLRARRTASALTRSRGSPANRARAHGCQIRHGPVRRVCFELLQFMSAGGYGEDFRANGPPAANVQGGVANQDDLLASDFGAKHAGAALERDARDLVAIFMIIGEGARYELLPEVEVAQFDFGTELDVAREQAEEWWFRQGFQFAEERPDARTFFGFALGEEVVEPEGITVEKSREVFAGGWNMIQREKLAHETDIGATRESDRFGAVQDAELRGEHFGEGFHAGAAGANQRAVNVE